MDDTPPPPTNPAADIPALSMEDLREIALSISRLNGLPLELEIAELQALSEWLRRERCNDSWMHEPGSLKRLVLAIRSSGIAARWTKPGPGDAVIRRLAT
jgi:hypothetical protein